MARILRGEVRWADLDPTQEAGEVLPKLPELGVVGHDHQGRVGVQYAGRVQERGHHHGAQRHEGADPVLHDVRREGAQQFRVQRARGVLVDRAEVPNLTVRTAEAQGTRL